MELPGRGKGVPRREAQGGVYQMLDCPLGATPDAGLLPVDLLPITPGDGATSSSEPGSLKASLGSTTGHI